MDDDFLSSMMCKDTTEGWDGRPDGPDWDDLSPREKKAERAREAATCVHCHMPIWPEQVPNTNDTWVDETDGDGCAVRHEGHQP